LPSDGPERKAFVARGACLTAADVPGVDPDNDPDPTPTPHLTLTLTLPLTRFDSIKYTLKERKWNELGRLVVHWGAFLALLPAKTVFLGVWPNPNPNPTPTLNPNPEPNPNP
jgi:hypothetical protein